MFHHLWHFTNLLQNPRHNPTKSRKTVIDLLQLWQFWSSWNTWPLAFLGASSDKTGRHRHIPRQRCHVNMMSWIPCHVRTGPFFIGLYVAHHEILYWAAPAHYSIIVLGCSSPLFDYCIGLNPFPILILVWIFIGLNPLFSNINFYWAQPIIFTAT